jgi:hypothetical protein
MPKLELRNMIATYDRIVKSGRKEVYFNSDTNNMIVVNPLDKPETSTDVFNGITDLPYDYLINMLNTEHGLVIHWYKVEGTTSDYVIHYDLNPKELLDKKYSEIKKVLEAAEHEPAFYKYTYIKEDKVHKIKFD